MYRIGQTKAVNVFKFSMEGTIEEKVFDIQKKKDLAIGNAFKGIKGASKKAAKEGRMQDIMELFGL